jgi:hypothetical protein
MVTEKIMIEARNKKTPSEQTVEQNLNAGCTSLNSILQATELAKITKLSIKQA